jgi:protein TonB
MDYQQQQKSSSSHVVGLIAVVLLHVAIAYALVTGLARKVIEVIKPPIETKVVEDVKPPPPDTPPPPPPKLAAPPPPAYIPPPEVNIQTPVVQTQNVITSVTSTPQPAAPVQRIAASARMPPVIDAARSCKQPEYPAASRRNEETGTVLLRFLIGTDGKVVESKVESSSGYPRLDQAALKALSLCQFKPGTLDGKPEQSWASLKYDWQLQ